MSLDEFTSKLAHYLSGKDDADQSSEGFAEADVWFSRLQSPMSLMLPEGGFPIARVPQFFGEFLEDEFGLDGLKDAPVLRSLDKVYLTRFDIDLDGGLKGSTFFIGLTLIGSWSPGAIQGLGEFKLENPAITIGRVGPAGKWQMDVAGTVEVFGLSFAMSFNTDTKIINANYVGRPKKLDEVLKKAKLPTGGLKCDIASLGLLADLGAKAYELNIGLDQLEIEGLDANLRDVLLHAEKSGNHHLVSVTAVAEIAKRDFDIDIALSEEGHTISARFAPENAPIPVGDLAASLVQAIAPSAERPKVPDLVHSLAVTSAQFALDSGLGTYSVRCESALDVDGTHLRAGFGIEKSADQKATPGGYLMIGSTRFDLMTGTAEHRDEDVKILAASYGTDDAKAFRLKDDLLAHVTSNKAFLDLVPSLKISLEGAVFARISPEDGDAVIVLGAAMAASTSVDLTALPLVGGLASAAGLPPKAGIGDFQVLLTNGEVSATQLGALNDVLDSNDTNPYPYNIPLPEGEIAQEDDETLGLKHGFNIRGTMSFGDGPLIITAGGGGGGDESETQVSKEDKEADDAARKNPDKATSPLPSPAGDATWFAIQKKLGPLYFEKIGVTYRDGELWLLPGADLTMAGLTIGLEGLAVSSPLDHFKPTFHLSGLSIDFRKGPLEIGGAFQRFQENGHDEYMGALVLRTEALSLSAMGAYAPADHDPLGKEHGPSMFVYLSLDYPLGGPPFFFVEGLTAGFGYNRSLKIPPIKQLAEFPFIATVMGTAPKSECPKGAGENMAAVRCSLQSQMAGMHDLAPAEDGENWLAAGIKFTSLKIVDGFALLTVAFGHRLEIHLLGAATYSYPPGSEETGHPLTQIEVLIDAAYLPDEGTLTVLADIAPGSFVFDPDCHLVGGLAFKTWFKNEHKDDFVLTIGGYHKDFKIPAHYPHADRLAFNWQKSDALSIKGGIYFAMTPNYLMAGGFLDATWESGALKAWLKITADFLIRYKPFHYDAAMSIDIGAQVTIHFFGTHHLSVHLGANLHIWGPPFSGEASFDIWIASFSVSFGAGAHPPPPIPWHQFAQSFLPSDKDVLTLGVADGLIQTLKRNRLDLDSYSVMATENDDDTHWVINPKHFTILVNQFIPHNAPTSGQPGTGTIGIAPMKVDKDSFCSHLTVSLDYKHTGKAARSLLDDFLVESVNANAPAGLWGNSYELKENSDAVVAGVQTGIQLTPANTPTVGTIRPIDRDELAFETEEMDGAWTWQDPTQTGGKNWSELGAKWASDAAQSQFSHGKDSDKRRATILAVLGRDDLSGGLAADELLVAPSGPNTNAVRPTSSAGANQ